MRLRRRTPSHRPHTPAVWGDLIAPDRAVDPKALALPKQIRADAVQHHATLVHPMTAPTQMLSTVPVLTPAQRWRGGGR